MFVKNILLLNTYPDPDKNFETVLPVILLSLKAMAMVCFLAIVLLNGCFEKHLLASHAI
jgi:hypothetical protein